jgi:hypothetical protein
MPIAKTKSGAGTVRFLRVPGLASMANKHITEGLQKVPEPCERATIYTLWSLDAFDDMDDKNCPRFDPFRRMLSVGARDARPHAWLSDSLSLVRCTLWLRESVHVGATR